MGVLALDLVPPWVGSTQVPLELFQMVYNGNVPTKSGEMQEAPFLVQKLTKIGFCSGSFGLESDAPIGGECLGTIRTIPDGI